MKLSDEAIKSALNFIKYRPRSTKEIYDKLKSKSFDNKTIEETISFLTKNSFLDDREFAKLWVNERLFSKNLSLAKIKGELRAKGIAEDIIQEILSNIEVDELENAFNFLLQKFSKVIDKKTLDKEKMLRKLISKGFSYKTSEKAVNKFLEKF
ncbi:MAG: recombination regulator RecX [Brevinematales bacterium]|nr:recombination regulator RecX [Brevinematales bacterium]